MACGWRPIQRYADAVLDLLDMKACNPSTSPKLDKQTEPEDEQLSDQPARFRSCVGILLYLARRRPDLQAVLRWLCKRARESDRNAERQLHKVARYLKGTLDLATFVPKDGNIEEITGYVDGDWGCDDYDRKSVSGGFIMIGGARLHSHSRTTAQHALSSGESEVMALSELLKVAKLM